MAAPVDFVLGALRSFRPLPPFAVLRNVSSCVDRREVMMQFTNEELEEMIQNAGGVPQGTEGTPVGGNPSPIQIMAEVEAQGIQIPWAQIGQFLICVLVGIWTQSLPAAVASCGLVHSGGGSVSS
ncbi:MAG: hypothetical protein ABI165_21930 [Bryobacteraceae bacterium]